MKLLAIAGVNIVLGTMLLGIVPTANILVLVGSIGVLCFSVHVLVMSFKDDLITGRGCLEVSTRIDSAKLAAIAVYSVLFGACKTEEKKTVITDITIR